MGTAKNFHIGIKAIIVQARKVLVVFDPRFHGYDLPGGKIDIGEGIEEALKRELNEELGLKKFEMGELLHVFERTDYKEKDISLMLIFYKVKTKVSKIKLDTEHTGYKWISKKDFIEIVKNGKIRNDGIKIALEKVLK